MMMTTTTTTTNKKNALCEHTLASSCDYYNDNASAAAAAAVSASPVAHLSRCVRNRDSCRHDGDAIRESETTEPILIAEHYILYVIISIILWCYSYGDIVKPAQPAS